jgi:hypothetical protein
MYRHLGAARHVIKRLASPLHVIAVVFNPLRFVSRYNLFREFEAHAESNPEIELYIVELALGDRPFEVTKADNPKHFQLRTYDELWHKERMINYAVSQLPPEWEYCAWVDADVTFLNPDWGHETLQQLQHYQIVQMFTHAIDLGPNGEPTEQFEGFAYSYINGRREFPALAGVERKKLKDPHHHPKPHDGELEHFEPVDIDGYFYMPKWAHEVPKHVADYYSSRYWHPGYGWAYRREAWDMLGGLLDINIVGGGDHQMAYGLIGRIEETIPAGSTDAYAKVIRNWGVQAELVKRDIGAVPGTLTHHYHGKKSNRGYYNRWKILTGNEFDPILDIKRDWQMMWTLTGNKIELRDQLRAYFRQRNEDSTE